MSIHLDLILYLALFAILIWRMLCPWRCCGQWLHYLNYISVLYLLLVCLFITEVVTLVQAAIADFASKQDPATVEITTQPWLRCLILASPVAMLSMLLVCWLQTKEHITKIQQHKSELQHDRAVMIIALPPFYGVLAMSAMVQSYSTDVRARGGVFDHEYLAVEFARFETCFNVADLYEAWALFQFGRLTLEVISASLALQEGGKNPKLLKAFNTMSSLMWTGTFLFLIVTILQAGCSLYMWTFGGAAEHYEKYESLMSQFTLANYIASGAAIYNVQVVEHTFHSEMENYSGLLKFLSVKLMVVFSFWQKGVFVVGSSVGLLHMSKVQIDLTHCTFMIYECFLAAAVHRFAWRAEEDWYNIGAPKEDDDERTPLVPPSPSDGRAGAVNQIGAAQQV